MTPEVYTPFIYTDLFQYPTEDNHFSRKIQGSLGPKRGGSQNKIKENTIFWKSRFWKVNMDLNKRNFGQRSKRRAQKKRLISKQKPGHSDKIEVNPSYMYRITDPIQLSFIIFPHKDAKQLRAAFIAIFFTIRNDPHQKIGSTDWLARKFDLPLSAICKARSKMSRIGLIRKKNGYWQYSNLFFTAIERFLDTIEGYMGQVSSVQKEAVFQFVEIAKNL